MKLYCVRHGHAEQLPNAAGDYPLSPQGEAEISQVAGFLAQRSVFVTQVMHSGKLRALQTAVRFSAAISDGSVKTCALLNGEYPVEAVLAFITACHEDVLLVSHMPLLSQLINALLLADKPLSANNHDIMHFSPGTVVCLDRLDRERWLLDWVLRPDLIPSVL